MIIKPCESNCRMMKSGKNWWKKGIKKQNISKTKWDCQNSRIMSSGHHNPIEGNI